MPKSRIIVILGALIALLPLLHFPKAGESFFQIVAGLSIVGLSVWTNIDKKMKLQIKAQQRQARKLATSSSNNSTSVEESGQTGRRLSDLNPTTINDNSENTEF